MKKRGQATGAPGPYLLESSDVLLEGAYGFRGGRHVSCGGTTPEEALPEQAGPVSGGAGGGRAIRHYRYTTPTHWFVVRGAETGADSVVMRDVCARIIDSGYFAGREFSGADDFIYRTACMGAGPGNSTNWREINTTHHITRVVRDMGAVKGLEFKAHTFAPEDVQEEMFR